MLFSFLYLFNLFYIGITSPGNYYNAWLDAHLNYIRGLRNLLLSVSEWLLERMGYDAYTGSYSLHVIGRSGIKLVYSCLGYGVMSFFTAFVLAWPKPFRDKILVLLAGLVFIQTLNILRFILLSLYWKKNAMNGFIDHHDLYNLVIYAAIGLLLYWWVNREQVTART